MAQMLELYPCLFRTLLPSPSTQPGPEASRILETTQIGMQRSSSGCKNNERLFSSTTHSGIITYQTLPVGLPVPTPALRTSYRRAYCDWHVKPRQSAVQHPSWTWAGPAHTAMQHSQSVITLHADVTTNRPIGLHNTIYLPQRQVCFHNFFSLLIIVVRI